MNCPLPIITHETKSEFTVKYDELKSFIDHFASGKNFAILINFGSISQGKSTFSQHISGFKHAIGNDLAAETLGAQISYCGTIQDIINKFNIKEEITSNTNIHVFNIDTEGILYDENENVTKFLLPLIQTSTLLIGYTESFTDLSLVPLLSDIYRISKINILITVKNSHSIIRDEINSISEYMRRAKLSDLSKKLINENIRSTIIPCVDFRDDVQHQFSKIMNNYFISRALNLMSDNQWNDSSTFINQLKNLYSIQNNDFIHSIFTRDSPSDSILRIISNDCYTMINNLSENCKDASFYDNLIQQITEKFNRMCDNAKIEPEKKEEKLKEIIYSIQMQKLNFLFELNQKEEEEALINEKTSKIEREKNLVQFLNREVSNVSNIFLLNLINFIKNKDIPSLKSIDSFYLTRCNDIISTASPHLRKEMLDHIDNDVNDISKVLQKNASCAINLIEKQKIENIKILIEFGIRVGGVIAGAALKFTKYPILGEMLCHIFKVPENPFKLVDEPTNEKFSLKISGKTYEASESDLCAFCSDIATRFGPMARSVFETMFQEIDLSQIDSLPIDFDSRDYVQYLENLIQNE